MPPMHAYMATWREMSTMRGRALWRGFLPLPMTSIISPHSLAAIIGLAPASLATAIIIISSPAARQAHLTHALTCDDYMAREATNLADALAIYHIFDCDVCTPRSRGISLDEYAKLLPLAIRYRSPPSFLPYHSQDSISRANDSRRMLVNDFIYRARMRSLTPTGMLSALRRFTMPPDISAFSRASTMPRGDEDAPNNTAQF